MHNFKDVGMIKDTNGFGKLLQTSKCAGLCNGMCKNMDITSLQKNKKENKQCKIQGICLHTILNIRHR